MFDIQEVSAAISALISRFVPLYARVTAFDAPNKLTMTSCPRTSPAEFFPGSIKLSNAQKQYLYLRYACSFGCDMFVLMYAIAIKQLIDSGIPLSYNMQPIVDVWILSSDEFPVGDLHQSALILRDARSGACISALNTYHNMQKLRMFGRDISGSFGLHDLGKFDGPQESSPSFRDTVRHCWLAFTVENSLCKDKDSCPALKLVHIDLCGAAYSDDGLRMHNGELVSLHMFESPQYVIRYSRFLSRSEFRRNPHKFRVTSLVRTSGGKEVGSLMPNSVRHLRCLYSIGSSTLQMTPLPAFVNKGVQDFVAVGLWRQQVTELRDSLVLGVPGGTSVKVCGLRNRTELNGRAGRVLESEDARRAGNSSEGTAGRRISVQVSGLPNAVRLRPECVCIDPKLNQYRTFKDLILKADALV